MERCSGCMFWDQWTKRHDDDSAAHPDDYRGECRRYPPSVHIDGGDTEFVTVRANNWCGEFSPTHPKD